MKRIFLFFSIALLCLTQSKAQESKKIDLPYSIDFKKIETEKGRVNYTLEEILDTIKNSISKNNTVVVPKNTTEFEKSLFIARRVQHNDSQLVAVKMLKILLEFELYRTRGEELYIRLLISNSLEYLGAPLIAYNYTADVFPTILEEISDSETKAYLLTHYAGLLIKLKRIEEAKLIYKKNLKIYTQVNDKKEQFSTRNNLGCTHQLLGDLDSAKALFRFNQDPIYQNLNPILYAFSFGNYGTVLKQEGITDSAIYFIRKEVDLLNSIQEEEGIYNAFLALGQLYEKKELFDSSRFYYHKALKSSEKAENIPMIIKSYQNLIQLYTINHNNPELNYFVNQYLHYNDSLINIKNLKAAQEEIQVSQFLDIFNETKESRELNDKLETNNRELILISLALSFLVLLLVFSISIRQKDRKKLRGKNLELKEKNRELEESYFTISESNKKNEILLKELHHRVKNNLQIISSLFNLQLNASKLDLSTERVFKDAKNRIHSISLVHKKIYQSDNVNSLDFEEYIRDFSDELLKANPNDVDLSIDIKRDPIPIESAIPLGLIFNELFTNSLKHSKQTDLLKISIQYIKIGNKEKFIYIDNGVGVKNIEVMKDSDSSIGVTLIHLLCEQLGCEVNYKEAIEKEHGFWLSIEGNFN